jgi:hypothetical protein
VSNRSVKTARAILDATTSGTRDLRAPERLIGKFLCLAQIASTDRDVVKLSGMSLLAVPAGGYSGLDPAAPSNVLCIHYPANKSILRSLRSSSLRDCEGQAKREQSRSGG